MSIYEAPRLFVDEFVPDTMIASGSTQDDPTRPTSPADPTDPTQPSVSMPKNNNAENNQNCWGCRNEAGRPDPNDSTTACCYLPGTDVYSNWC